MSHQATPKKPRGRPLFIVAYVAVLSLVGYFYVLPVGLQTGWAISLKLTDRATLCTWSRVLKFYTDLSRFDRMLRAAQSRVRVLERDVSSNLEKFSSSVGPFWVPHEEGPQRGIGYLIAEHDWVAATSADQSVREGDIVIDVGAHIGVFTRKPLQLGAEQVVAIEPYPQNVECLRRNFAKEIESGRVVVVASGAWNEKATLALHIGDSSAWNSFVHPMGADRLDVLVRSIDDILAELGLPSIDFIKIDVEGAEVEVVQGAAQILQTHKPRLMVDVHQGSSRWESLPAVIQDAQAGYQISCGPCQPSEGEDRHILPHVIFFYSRISFLAVLERIR